MNDVVVFHFVYSLPMTQQIGLYGNCLELKAYKEIFLSWIFYRFRFLTRHELLALTNSMQDINNIEQFKLELKSNQTINEYYRKPTALLRTEHEDVKTILKLCIGDSSCTVYLSNLTLSLFT